MEEFNEMMEQVIAQIESRIVAINEDGVSMAECMIIHPTSCNQLEEYLYPGDPANWSEPVYFTFPNQLEVAIRVYKSTQVKQGEIKIY